MAKLKSSSLSEIHWKLKGWNQGDNAMLRKLLKEDADAFARAHVGPANVEWTDETSGWRPLSTASDADRPLAEKALRDVSQRVRARAPEKYANPLLSVPNDDYIFYRIDDDGTARVLLTGWGYANSNKATGEAYKIKKEEAPTTPVTIGFTVEGEFVGSRPFSVLLESGRGNSCTTDAEGRYLFPTAPIGKNIRVRDDISGKSFSFTPQPGVAEQMFDVTQKVQVSASTSLNGRPVSDYPVRLRYRGQEMTLPVAQGQASATLTYWPGETVDLECNGLSRQINLSPNSGDNHVDFDFERDETAKIRVKIRLNGQPTDEWPANIFYDGHDYMMQTSNGVGTKDVTWREGAECRVTVGDLTQTAVLQPGAVYNDFIFEMEEVLPPPPPVKPVTVRILDKEGKPFAGARVSFTQNGKTLQNSLDQNGIVRFGINEFKVGEPIVTSVVTTSRTINDIRWSLDPDEYEYELTEMGCKGSKWWLELLAALGILLGSGVYIWALVQICHQAADVMFR